MIAMIVQVLIYLLILGLIWWAVDRVLAVIPLPGPIKPIVSTVVLVILVLLAALALLKLVAPLASLIGSFG